MSVEAIFSVDIREALQHAGALRFGDKERIKDLIGVLRAGSPTPVSVTDTISRSLSSCRELMISSRIH